VVSKLTERGKLLAEADPRIAPANTSRFAPYSGIGKVRLPTELSQKMLTPQEPLLPTVVDDSPLELVQPAVSKRKITLLCPPLVNTDWTICISYLECPGTRARTLVRCVAVMSTLASGDAVSVEVMSLPDTLREPDVWKGEGPRSACVAKSIWSTATLRSRASRECRRILGHKLDVNVVLRNAFRNRVRGDDYLGLDKPHAEETHAQFPLIRDYKSFKANRLTLRVGAAGQFAVTQTADLELEGISMDVAEPKVTEDVLAVAQAHVARAGRPAQRGELGGFLVHELDGTPTRGLQTPKLDFVGSGSSLPRRARTPGSRHVLPKGDVGGPAPPAVECTWYPRDRSCLPTVGFRRAPQKCPCSSKKEPERGRIPVKTALDTTPSDIEADKVQLSGIPFIRLPYGIASMVATTGGVDVPAVFQKGADSDPSVTLVDSDAGTESAISDLLWDALSTTSRESTDVAGFVGTAFRLR